MEAFEFTSLLLVSILPTIGSEAYFAFDQKTSLKLKKSSWQTLIFQWKPVQVKKYPDSSINGRNRTLVVITKHTLDKACSAH